MEVGAGLRIRGLQEIREGLQVRGLGDQRLAGAGDYEVVDEQEPIAVGPILRLVSRDGQRPCGSAIFAVEDGIPRPGDDLAPLAEADVGVAVDRQAAEGHVDLPRIVELGAPQIARIPGPGRRPGGQNYQWVQAPVGLGGDQGRLAGIPLI